MKKLFTLTITFLIGLSAHAQNSIFESGYIVQNQDTIQGYIQAAPDQELSYSIKFKSNLQAAEARKYLPGDITGFGFRESGINYASVTAEVTNGSLTQRASRFAKLLLSGYTNLYKLQLPEEEQAIVLKRNNTFLYILRKDDTDYTLGHYEHMQADGRIRHDKRYVGVLRALFLDCETQGYSRDLTNLDNLKFEDKSIVEVVSAYNNCKNPSQQTVIHEYKSKYVMKHGPEASYAWLSHPKTEKTSTGQGFSMGYFWDIVQPDLSRKYSTKLGVNYFYLKQTIKNRHNGDISRAIHFIRIPLSGQVNLKDPLNSPNIPFFNVGLTAQVSKWEDGSDYIPFPHIGVGMYTRKMRYAFLLENDGFGIRNPKILNLTVGVRLD